MNKSDKQRTRMFSDIFLLSSNILAKQISESTEEELGWEFL